MCVRVRVCVCVCVRALPLEASPPAPTGSCAPHSWGLGCCSEHQWPGEEVNPPCLVDFPQHFSLHNSSNDLGLKLLLGINNQLGLMALTVSWAIFPVGR